MEREFDLSPTRSSLSKLAVRFCGSAGPPAVDRDDTVIDAAFEGNIHSPSGNYVYEWKSKRTIAVSAAALPEGLEQIYPAPNFVAELKAR